MEGVLYYQGLPYVPEIIQSELISQHHNNPLTGHFRIEKIRELMAQKYFWSIFCQDVEAYVKVYDVCLTSKIVRHKLYRDLPIIKKTCL